MRAEERHPQAPREFTPWKWRSLLKALPTLIALYALVLSGCRSQAEPELDPVVKSAMFGVFFGGQIQERVEIPFEIDKQKQAQGIRIEFRAPLRQNARVSWEFDRPAPKGVQPSPSTRVVQLGQAEVKAGSERFEVPLPLVPGDPLGEWNVRALVDGRLVLDQRFSVYNAALRAAAERRAVEEEE